MYITTLNYLPHTPSNYPHVLHARHLGLNFLVYRVQRTMCSHSWTTHTPRVLKTAQWAIQCIQPDDVVTLHCHLGERQEGE
jgi:hypothetical protein